MANDITNPQPVDLTDERLDRSLRPQRLEEYFGQEHLKRNLKIFIQAAKQRREPLDHTLFYGPPGLGKTTLAHVLAHEMEVSVRITSGPAIERPGDLASILTNLQSADILFIDEIHRLSKIVEETLYPAMEDFALDLVIGKGPSARTVRLDLPHFTIVGATTRVGLITSPLRDRFGSIYRLDFYNPPALEKIIARSAKILRVPIEKPAIAEIARRCRGTPRIANRLLKRVRDYAQVKNKGKISLAVIHQALDLLQVDQSGLTQIDRQILQVLINKFDGGPVGLDTLAATLSEDAGTVEEVIEPYLLQQGFLKRTKAGRVATPLAYRHFGLALPV